MRTMIYRLTILCLLLMTGVSVLSQATVRVVVNRDDVNIRIVPALGAELLGTANAGTTFVATGRSPDGEWLQIEFSGTEAWIGTVVVTILEGDVNALPIRDPRSIPYGGQAAPRAGYTQQTSDILARLPNSGIRVRSGPSTAYPVLADAPRFSEFPLLGRTANNQWVQINYNGTLGWIAASYIEIQGNRSIVELPIDGIVASQPPLRFDAENEFFGILRRMRDRLDLAQPSVDAMQRIWTDAALGIVPVCGGYPSRPTDFSIPRDIYAEYYALLDPLLVDFNLAMANTRNSIDLLIETCNRPGGSAALISPPVTTGGLEFINDADIQITSLRRRIDELLPELGPDDCVFAFSGRVDVLPTLSPLQPGFFDLFADEFDRTETTLGYCFDATQINVGRLELIRTNVNYGIVVAIAPIDDPTNFIATGAIGESSASGSNLIIYPISFPKDGRYLLILDARLDEGEAPEGDFNLLLMDFSFGTPTGSFFALDENGNIVFQDVTYTAGDAGTSTAISISGGESSNQLTTTSTDGTTGTNNTNLPTTGTVTNNTANPITIFAQANTSSNTVGTLAPGATATINDSQVSWYFIRLSDGTVGWVQSNQVTYTPVTTSSTTTSGNTTTSSTTSGLASSPALCPGVTLTCDELFTCTEVQACINAGSTVLDPNGNGVACDSADGVNPLGCSVSTNPNP